MRTTLAGLALLLAACPAGHSPASAVMALSEAAHDGNLDEVVHLLGPETRARLNEEARVATRQGGRNEIRPRELIAVGWTAAPFRILEIRELARADGHARVLVIGRSGEREEVRTVKERDGWKVELP